MFFCYTLITTIFNNLSNNMEINAKKDYEITNEIIVQKEITNEKSIFINNVWKIEIPKIGLSANIAEGTEKAILDKYVGHFLETSKLEGNIGLAAHNRGYTVNYFEKIKELVNGDEIYYTYNGITKKYVVILKTIIKDTEWKYLQNTEDNRLTLITCVENQPSYRRCIQAIENK